MFVHTFTNILAKKLFGNDLLPEIAKNLLTSPNYKYMQHINTVLTLKVLVSTIDAHWEGMGDVGSARYEPALLPPCPTIRVLNYSN